MDTLYWRDRNLRFHRYELLAPSNRVDDLLTEVDRDPTCIFWGTTAGSSSACGRWSG